LGTLDSVGASKNAIIFTNRKVWLIIRPMKEKLDVKFYYDESSGRDVFKKKITVTIQH
jgi:hypothetical protein